MRLALLSVVPVVGATLTLTLFLIFRGVQQRESALEFHKEVQRRIAALKDAVSDKLSVVRALEAFFNASTAVDRDEFTTFTEQLLKAHLMCPMNDGHGGAKVRPFVSGVETRSRSG